jgi:hypothetical protein
MWAAVKPTTGVRQIGWIASLVALILVLEFIKLTFYP